MRVNSEQPRARDTQFDYIRRLRVVTRGCFEQTFFEVEEQQKLAADGLRKLTEFGAFLEIEELKP